MTLKDFIEYTRGMNEDDVVRYKDEAGVFFWGDPIAIDWSCDFEDKHRHFRFHSEKELLESPCFWGKRLEEIVSELTIDGYDEWVKEHSCSE